MSDDDRTSRAQFNATPEGRTAIIDEAMRAEIRRMRGVMKLTTEALVKALHILAERAPDAVGQFPAPDEDAVAAAMVRAQRELERGRDPFRLPPDTKVRTRTKRKAAKPKASKKPARRRK